MTERDWLAEQFETNRAHLSAVAYRLLGSESEAHDAVQETWLRLSRTDTSNVENLGGWLTTVVGRVCLDMLRARKSRREEPLEPPSRSLGAASDATGNPEHEALVADSVGLAMLVVLDSLAPPERVAFVLHDVFALPFDEIAPIVGRSPEATRQLASRARRRVRGAAEPEGDAGRRGEIVAAFLAASREGNFDALLAVLDPDAVLMADGAAVQMGAQAEVRGRKAVAETLAGRAKAARLALVDGAAGAAWMAGGKPRVVFEFAVRNERIVRIDLLADEVRLAEMDVELVEA
jgi:RNA polymerase sigma-70 factor (ECF subfamily)